MAYNMVTCGKNVRSQYAKKSLQVAPEISYQDDTHVSEFIGSNAKWVDIHTH